MLTKLEKEFKLYQNESPSVLIDRLDSMGRLDAVAIKKILKIVTDAMHDTESSKE